MSSQHNPVVGNWYRNFEEQIFEVVTVNDDENVIEIQYLGGEIDELDYEVWYSLGAESVPPPEDWASLYDEIQYDDLDYTEFAYRGNNLLHSFDEYE